VVDCSLEEHSGIALALADPVEQRASMVTVKLATE
jgi:hypothetical protein